MTIHLIGSMRKFNEDLPVLRKIAQIIYENGHSLAVNWFDGVDNRKKKKTLEEENLDWVEIVEGNIECVLKADALIVEGSRFNYSQGYQTAVALHNSKPVLNLYQEAAEELAWPDKMFVSGVSNPLFSSKSYKSMADLEKIIGNFLVAHNAEPAQITITLDRKMKLYIDSLAPDNERSVEIIEELIRQKMTESESHFLPFPPKNYKI